MSICCRFLRMPSAAGMPSICARRCSIRSTSPNRITPSIPTCKSEYIIWIEIGVSPQRHKDTERPRQNDLDRGLSVFLCLCGDTFLIEEPYARHNAFKFGAVSFEVEFR